MSRVFLLFVLLALILMGCSPAQPVVTPTVIPTLTRTPKPTAAPSLTPSPTPDPPVEDLDEKATNVLGAIGIEVFIDIHQNKILRLNGKDIPKATLKDGVVSINGELITTDELKDRISFYEQGILLKDEFGDAQAIYNPNLVSPEWAGKWNSRDQIIQPSPENAESYIKVSTWDAYDELVTFLEVPFLPKFPDQAYLTPADKVYYQYSDHNSLKRDGEFTSGKPLGVRSDFSESQFSYANHIILLPNSAEDRDYYGCVLTQAALENDRTTFGIHFGSSPEASVEACGVALRGMRMGGDNIESGDYMLVLYSVKADALNRYAWAPFIRDSYKYYALSTGPFVDTAQVRKAVVDYLLGNGASDILKRAVFFGKTCSLDPNTRS